jgi:hypothetical protein
LYHLNITVLDAAWNHIFRNGISSSEPSIRSIATSQAPDPTPISFLTLLLQKEQTKISKMIEQLLDFCGLYPVARYVRSYTKAFTNYNYSRPRKISYRTSKPKKKKALCCYNVRSVLPIGDKRSLQKESNMMRKPGIMTENGTRQMRKNFPISNKRYTRCGNSIMLI